MIDAFFNALSGLRTASRRLDISANNTANLQTPGFKKSRPVIMDIKTGGSQILGTQRNNASGALLPTNDPLNLAIDGPGYFQVTLPDGSPGFTRFGAFKSDNSGRLVTANGHSLKPEISVPLNTESISVNSSGQVTGFSNGQSITLGQIQLSGFNDPSGLTSLGGNIFAASSASGQPVSGNPGSGGLGLIRSGALETSNVDITEEAVEQILSKAAFRANASVIRTSNEIVGTILDIKA